MSVATLTPEPTRSRDLPRRHQRLDRACGDPRGYLAVLIVTIGLVLTLDQWSGPATQWLIGVATWGVLLACCRPLPADERMRVAVVVVVATCAEIFGSIIWGVYTYRLENLPSFVPPGHGMIYLGGVHFARIAWVKRNVIQVRALTICALALWGVAGLAVFDRTDVLGALGGVALAIVLIRSTRPALYCGVFLAVAALEIYGTAIGTWYWHELVPHTAVTSGNPPSGVASGYVLFDVAALTFGPLLLRHLTRRSVRQTAQVPSI